MLVLIGSLLVAMWFYYRSESADERGWMRNQAVAVGALLLAGVVGAILQPGVMRYAWLVLAAGAAVRLALIPRQARARTARRQVAAHPSE